MLLLRFTAGTNRYAVDALRVVEVIPRVDLRQIPHAPEYFAGFLRYRGRVAPVIDLGSFLGASPCRERLSTRIILVKAAPGNDNDSKQGRLESAEHATRVNSNQAPDQDLLGLLAEEVCDLTRATPDQVSSAYLNLTRSAYLGAVVQVDDELVQLLAVEKLAERLLREAVPDSSEV
jgi:chemotaxis-related protein WspB